MEGPAEQPMLAREGLVLRAHSGHRARPRFLAIPFRRLVFG